MSNDFRINFSKPYTYKGLVIQSLSSDIVRKTLQTPTTQKALFLINALINQGKLEGDSRAIDLLKELPITIKRMVLKMKEEALLISKAKKGNDIPPPEALHPVTKQPFSPWVKQSAQVLLSQLTEGARNQAEALYRRTTNDNSYDITKRSEYASIVLELADGKAIRPTACEATSYKVGFTKVNKVVENASDVLYRAQERAKKKQAIREGTVKAYILHTHPQDIDNLYVVNVHEDGRYFTYLSPADCFAVDKYFDEVVNILRKAGFTGPINISIGAIPVPFRPEQDLSERLYVAIYTREIPGVKPASAKT